MDALFVVNGPGGYVSPGWYGLGPNQMPTWNYVAMELEGTMHPMDHDVLIDRLSAEQESRLSSKPAWRRDKVDPLRIDRMLDVIVGYRFVVEEWRGTIRLGQNNPAVACPAAADASAAAGRPGVALWMGTLA